MYQERYIDLQKRVFPLLSVGLRAKSEQLWENFLDNGLSLRFSLSSFTLIWFVNTFFVMQNRVYLQVSSTGVM